MPVPRRQASTTRRTPVARRLNAVSRNSRLVSQRDYDLIIREINNPSEPTEEMKALAAHYRNTITTSR